MRGWVGGELMLSLKVGNSKLTKVSLGWEVVERAIHQRSSLLALWIPNLA